MVRIDEVAPAVEIAGIESGEAEDNRSYYNKEQGQPEVTLRITEHFFNTSEIGFSTTAKNDAGADVEKIAQIGEETFTAAELEEYLNEYSNWSGDGDVHEVTLTLLDAEYTDFLLTCTDEAAWNGSDSKTDFTVDIVEPSVLKVSYETSVFDQMSGVLFFNDTVTVTVTAEDTTSGVKTITLYYEDGEEYRTLDAEKQADGSYLATTSIAPEFREKLHAVATDDAGNSSDGETAPRTEIVVDSIAPNIWAEYSDTNLVRAASEQARDYYLYNGEAEITVVVKEDNFDFYNDKTYLDSKDDTHNKLTFTVTRFVDGKTVEKKPDFVQRDDGTYATTIRLKELFEESSAVSQEYTLSVSYADGSGNQGTYTSVVRIDETAPVVKIGNVESGDDKNIRYYKEQPKAKLTVTEHFFDTSAISFETIARDCAGKDVDQIAQIGGKLYTAKELAEYLAVYSNWSGDGDVHEVTLTLLDAEYADFLLTCVDEAAWEGRDSRTDFTVDTVAPSATVNVSYTDTAINKLVNILFFRSTVTATITAEDKTSGIGSIVFNYPVMAGASAVNTGNTGELTLDKLVQQEGGYSYSAACQIEPQYNGQLKVLRVTDKAGNVQGNPVASYNADGIIVDSIAPVANITIRTPAVDEGKVYYDTEVTATVTIEEANFYAANYTVSVDGQAIAVDWASAGDTHTATILVTEDGEHVISVNGADYSGNTLQTQQTPTFIIDTVDPVLSVDGVMNGSANDTEEIGLTIQISDDNLDSSSIEATLIYYYREKNDNGYSFKQSRIDLTPYMKENEDGSYTVFFDEFVEDGYYELQVSYADFAGHRLQKMMQNNMPNDAFAFTVNREGSVYLVEITGKDADGKTIEISPDYDITNATDIQVVINEYNADEINMDEAHKTSLVINNGTSATNMEITEDIFREVPRELQSNSATPKENKSWYHYTYTLGSELFETDGDYSINLITQDKTPNRQVNTNMKEDPYGVVNTINFIVDRTKPVIYHNIPTKMVNDQNFTVEVTIRDANLNPESISVVVDGETMNLNEGIRQIEDNKYTFEISGYIDDLSIDYVDAAGNAADTIHATDIVVSTNILLLWYGNKALFWGSIGGVAALTILIAILLGKKNRKTETV